MSIQLTLALRYLWGHKLRTLLTTLAVVLGVIMLFSMSGLLTPMLNAFTQNMKMSAGQVDLTITHVNGSPFTSDNLSKVTVVEGIAQATGALRQNVVLPASLGGSSDPMNGISAITVTGLDPVSAQQVRQFAIQSGRFLQPSDNQAVVIPEDFAQILKLKVGDILTLPSAQGTAQLQIVGILGISIASGTEDVYVNLPTAQKLLNMEGLINTIEVLYGPEMNRDEVQAAVLKNLGSDFEAGSLQTGTDLVASLKLANVAFYLFGLMALAMASFIIFNTFRTVVAERRHDLGMLRALGASRQTVVGIFVFESLIQGVVGTAIGMISGYLLATFILQSLGPIITLYMHAAAPAQPIYSMGNVIFTIVVGVGFTLLSGFIPALSASRTSPLQALRPMLGGNYETITRRTAIIGVILLVASVIGLLTGNFSIVSLATLLFLIGIVMVAPALVQPVAHTFGRLLSMIFAREGRIAQGNLVRQPNRAAVTASAMMIGLAIVIALAGIMSSITTSFIGYLDKSLGADLLIMPQSLVLGSGNLGASPKLAQNLISTPGISEITTLRLAVSQTRGSALQLIGIDPQTYPSVSGLVFSRGDSAQAYAALDNERAIIVNGIFSAQNSIKVGDMLTLQTAEGDQPYRVVGVGLDYLNAKLATAYISQSNLEKDFHQTSDVLLMANIAEGSDANQVRASVVNLVRDYPSFTLVDTLTFRNQSLKSFSDAMVMLYALMAVLALPSLVAMINTLAINVMERTREIGMLRALGSSRGMVRGMILAESLLLAFLGTALGILIGIWLGYVLVGAFNVSGFVLMYEFPYVGILIAIAVGLLFGVLAALIPARQAARMNIVSALRYE